MSDQELSIALIKEFVIAGHSDLAKIKELHAAEPRLLDARLPEFDETAIEAASHMGERGIAEYLISHGATKKITTTAMLGEIGEVRERLAADPTQSQAVGAHGFTLLFHASLSGNIELMDLLYASGSRGFNTALHVSVFRDDMPMLHWLIAHGVDPTAKDFRENTALDIARAQNKSKFVRVLEASS